METSQLRKRTPSATLLDPTIVVPAIGQAFVKLDPRTLIKNPVMFVLEIVSALTTAVLAGEISPRRSPKGGAGRRPTRCARPARRRAPSAS
jgi:hypothetical protein